MFIRKVKTRTLKDGRTYYATRLVHNVRYGNKVKQETLLNLGSNYNIHERNWTKLSQRVQELFVGQETFLPPLPKHLEDEAERIVQLLFDQRSERLKKAKLASRRSRRSNLENRRCFVYPNAVSAKCWCRACGVMGA